MDLLSPHQEDVVPKGLLEFVTKLPKSDLHVHLDGSVRIPTLIDLSKEHKLSLPSYNIEGLNELVFKDRYANLSEYLQGFRFVLPTMQTQENLERISYEFAQDNINEGVCYVEVRFAPQLHINNNQNIDQVLLSVNRGLSRAKSEYNQKPEVKSKQLPDFNYGIVVCALRSSTFATTSYELAKACVNIRDEHNIPIVALDLAGEEAGNPPIYHKEAYHFAYKNLMHLTAHAGEAYGPESIFQAITELYPERIGHGFYLFSQDKIRDPKIQDKDKDNYIKKLIQYIADRRITIEVCITSNLQTIPHLKNIKNHSFAQMLNSNLSTTICTDNRTISKTNVTKELMLAIQNFNLTKDSLKTLLLHGFKRSFYPGTYAEKLNYIKQVAIRFDLLSNQLKENKLCFQI